MDLEPSNANGISAKAHVADCMKLLTSAALMKNIETSPALSAESTFLGKPAHTTSISFFKSVETCSMQTYHRNLFLNIDGAFIIV
jgi:hypothetical protein